MKHICPKCNISMQEANLDHSGLVRIFKKGAEEKDKQGIFDFSNPTYMSNIVQYVCSKCGYIEFFASEPEKFK
jgi:predicted nucleic-acid-binding Zn-ribbon protein